MGPKSGLNVLNDMTVAVDLYVTQAEKSHLRENSRA